MKVRLMVCVVGVITTSACGTAAERSRTAAPSSSPSATSETLSVVLLHCGVKPVTVGGEVWEAPPQPVDRDPQLSLDATNRPKGWVGQGTYVINDKRMTYTDESGEVVEFLPDDAVPTPKACA